MVIQKLNKEQRRKLRHHNTRAETNIQIRNSGIRSVSLVFEYLKSIRIHNDNIVLDRQLKTATGIILCSFNVHPYVCSTT